MSMSGCCTFSDLNASITEGNIDCPDFWHGFAITFIAFLVALGRRLAAI